MSRYVFEDIAINSTTKKKPVEEDKYTYLGLENLDPETLKVTRFGNEVAPIGEKLIMKKGDVLFGKRRAYQRKVAIAPFDGIFSAHGMVLRPKTNVIDPDFFPFFISSDYFLDNAIRISVGSLSPTINWGDLKKLEFDLPSLQEQSKIAKILWSINNTIESYKDLLSKTKELEKSKFDKFLEETEGIRKIKIKDIGKYLPKSKMDASLGKAIGEFPFFTSSMDTVKWCDEYQYDDECIIMGNGGTASIKYYVGKFSTTTHGIVIKANRDDVMLQYVYEYLFNNIDILEHGFRGVGLKNIPKQYIDNIEIPIPSMDEQEKIVNMMTNFDKQIESINNTIAKLKTLFKKISAENICKKED